VVTSLTVRPLGTGFAAAEVTGFDPAMSGDPTAATVVRDALWAHGVVCIRFGEQLDDATARSLVAMVGPVKDPVGRTVDGTPLRYGPDRQVIDAGFVMTDEVRAALGGGSLGGDDERPGLFEFFHTDDSYVAEPALATVLHARALPSNGGDTCFLDMRAAFASLPPGEQEAVRGLRAVHAYNNGGAFPPRAAATGELEALAPVSHPVVRAHPVTGVPALYFDLDRATHLDGLPIEDGRAWLRALQDHAEQHAPVYRHRWRPHDVLVWDNAAVQHRASRDFAVGEPRRFWRYLVAGPVPLAA
jgi:alpha-ketoglutarate-dependent taurine dioxygenase